MAFDAATGAQRWKLYMLNYSVPQSAARCQANGGTPQQCLPTWNAKDSIVALDLTTGAIKWNTGPARFDEWNFGCLPGFPPNNCPNPGPDHDTGPGSPQGGIEWG